MSNELGRLAPNVGDRMKSGTYNIFFIHKHQVPTGRKSTYGNAVCDYRPLKDDSCRVLLVIGGNRIIYPGDHSAPAASLLDSKIIFNSTILTAGARFFCADVKDCFLNNPMSDYEYMKIQLRWFPQDIIDQY